jgi:hypothetical protein
MDSLWENFHKQYTDYFVVNHDVVMKSQILQEQYDEIKRSDEWWEFENLSVIEALPDFYWKDVSDLCRRFKELNCRFNVREMLKTHPFCGCSFTLSQAEQWEVLPQTLNAKLAIGRAAYRKMLRKSNDVLFPLIREFAGNSRGEGFTEAADKLIQALSDDSETTPFDTTQLIILQDVCQSLRQIESEATTKTDDSVSYETQQGWGEPRLIIN